jgi:hypothetical protein
MKRIGKAEELRTREIERQIGVTKDLIRQQRGGDGGRGGAGMLGFLGRRAIGTLFAATVGRAIWGAVQGAGQYEQNVIGLTGMRRRIFGGGAIGPGGESWIDRYRQLARRARVAPTEMAGLAEMMEAVGGPRAARDPQFLVEAINRARARGFNTAESRQQYLGAVGVGIRAGADPAKALSNIENLLASIRDDSKASAKETLQALGTIVKTNLQFRAAVPEEDMAFSARLLGAFQGIPGMAGAQGAAFFNQFSAGLRGTKAPGFQSLFLRAATRQGAQFPLYEMQRMMEAGITSRGTFQTIQQGFAGLPPEMSALLTGRALGIPSVEKLRVFFEGIRGKTFDEAQENIEGFNDALKDRGDTIEQSMAKMASNFEEVGEGVSEILVPLREMSKLIVPLGPTFGAVGTVVSGFNQTIDEAGKFIRQQLGLKRVADISSEEEQKMLDDSLRSNAAQFGAAAGAFRISPKTRQLLGGLTPGGARPGGFLKYTTNELRGVQLAGGRMGEIFDALAAAAGERPDLLGEVRGGVAELRKGTVGGLVSAPETKAFEVRAISVIMEEMLDEIKKGDAGDPKRVTALRGAFRDAIKESRANDDPAAMLQIVARMYGGEGPT